MLLSSLLGGDRVLFSTQCIVHFPFVVLSLSFAYTVCPVSLSFSFKLDPLPTWSSILSSQSPITSQQDWPEPPSPLQRSEKPTRYTRETQKKKKRTHSNGYSWSITIPIHWAHKEQPMTPLTDLSRLRSPPRHPSFSLHSLLSRSLLLRISPLLSHSLAHMPLTRAPRVSLFFLLPFVLVPSWILSRSHPSHKSYMYILGDRGEGSTSRCMCLDRHGFRGDLSTKINRRHAHVGGLGDRSSAFETRRYVLQDEFLAGESRWVTSRGEWIFDTTLTLWSKARARSNIML